MIDGEGFDAERPRHLGEIGIVAEVDLREVFVEKQFLPLPDHTQEIIIEDDDLDWQPTLSDGT